MRLIDKNGNSSPIASTGDIISESSGKSLETILTKQDSDIEKLKGNVLWLYGQLGNIQTQTEIPINTVIAEFTETPGPGSGVDDYVVTKDYIDTLIDNKLGNIESILDKILYL